MANSSFYISGKGSSPAPSRTYEPAVDKNPFYRTNDIFSRAHKKTIKLAEGQTNQTDCTSTIWVKFSDPIYQQISENLGLDGGRSRYLLKCGHEWEGKLAKQVGESIPCMKCGAEQGYLGFEHEWQHIIFKTDPKAARVFIDAWSNELRQKAPHVDKEQLEKFLFFILNAFDDIRCNSLWELLYPGSAERIWKRWTRISSSRTPQQNSANFISFLFAVALGTPTDPQGPFEEMRPCIEWGMQHVRYKGYRNAMTVAKLSLDQCLDYLLYQEKPPQPQPQQQQGASNGQAAQQDPQDDSASGGDSSSSDDDSATGSGVGGSESDTGPLQGSMAGDGEVDEGDGEEPSQSQDQGQGVEPVQASPTETSNALSSLIRKAGPFDDKEEHVLPDAVSPTDLPDAVRAAVLRALNADGADQELTPDQIDPDMQASLDQFRDGMADMSQDSQLVSDARARVLFLDVEPEGIDPHSRIILSTKEEEVVARMRGIFYRTLGRQKAQRNASGLSVDMDAAIQYDIEPNDPEIFENEENNQGFAYLVLSDMSGSMSGLPFQQVCHGTEMLKKSLNFPFVDGTLWGFRGGDPVGGRKEVAGEVWLYRYNKSCQGYLGTARVERSQGKSFRFPVQCGGLTPMHSAVRVAVKHLLTRVSPGMAKRLFLLTDGSPCGTKTSGHSLPHFILQQYVAKEIQWARQKGIHVYTLVIGSQLEEKECRQMFGPLKYWRRVEADSGDNSVDRVLQDLVIQNFEKYLKSRG